MAPNARPKQIFSVYLRWMSETEWVEQHKLPNRQAPVPEQKEGVGLVERKHMRGM
jgi:hypothetical protein